MFTRDSQTRIDTLIGKAARVHGDVEFEGGLHLDGRIVGGVRCADAPGASLSVSETGSIEGEVQVPTVVLNGTIIGDIHARERIVLGATAKVQGSVYYGVIEMTLGAQIMGKLAQVSAEAKPGAGAGAKQTVGAP